MKMSCRLDRRSDLATWTTPGTHETFTTLLLDWRRN